MHRSEHLETQMNHLPSILQHTRGFQSFPFYYSSRILLGLLHSWIHPIMSEKRRIFNRVYNSVKIQLQTLEMNRDYSLQFSSFLLQYKYDLQYY